MGFALQKSSTAHVSYESKADVTLLNFDVRFTPESGHSSAQSKRPLWAKTKLMHSVIPAPATSAIHEQFRYIYNCLGVSLY